MISLTEFFDEDGFQLRRYLGSGRTAMVLVCLYNVSLLSGEEHQGSAGLAVRPLTCRIGNCRKA